MSPTELEILVDRLVEYLRAEHAVRVSETEVPGYRTVYQICDHLRIDLYKWSKVKAAANRIGVQRARELGEEHGFSIVFIQGKGHFLGWPGEEITNTIAKYQVAKGWVSNLRETREIIAKADPKQKAWIERRYKDFELESERDIING